MYELNGTEEKREVRQKIACGESVTTTYLVEGAVVRQDVRIEVDRGIWTNLTAGKVGVGG